MSRKLQDRAVTDVLSVTQIHNGAVLTTDQTVFGIPPNVVSAGSNSFIQQPNSALFHAPTPYYLQMYWNRSKVVSLLILICCCLPPPLCQLRTILSKLTVLAPNLQFL